MTEHEFVPDSYGDCEHCPLPERSPRHIKPAPVPAPAPALKPVPNLGVALTPNQSDASQQAALSAWPRAGTARAAVLDALAATGDHGATDDDLVFDTDLPANTLRPRRVELVAAGWVVAATDETGKPLTRKSTQGNDAQVWVLSPAARQQLDAA